MTAKEKRERLFRKSKPHIRPFTAEDLWVLWAAYDLESFKGLQAGLTKEQLFARVAMIASRHASCLLIEDECRWFKAGHGPIGFVTIANNGWRIEPHVDWFSWASPRMILRGTVSFFQMARYSKDVGVCVVRSLADTVPLFDRIRTYGLLFPVGRVPDGDARGDEWIYQVRGRKNVRTDGARSPERGIQRAGHGSGSPGDGEERSRDRAGTAVFGERGRESDRPEPAGDRESGERAIPAEAADATVSA